MSPALSSAVAAALRRNSGTADRRLPEAPALVCPLVNERLGRWLQRGIIALRPLGLKRCARSERILKGPVVVLNGFLNRREDV